MELKFRWKGATSVLLGIKGLKAKTLHLALMNSARIYRIYSTIVLII